MQVFGFLEKAQIENVSADLTNTLVGLVWFNTTDNKMRFYDNGAIRSVVDEDTTQTVSNKTFTSGAISNFLDFAHQTTPSSPAAGSISVYSKNDNKLYKLDSDGFEEEIGTGSGTGDINFCENPDCEKDLTGWNLYNDGPADKPVDGTGGTTGTLLLLRYTGAPLRGDASFLFRTASAAGNCYGMGYSNDFEIDPADQANMVDVMFDYLTEDAYATGNYVAYIYDITNAKLLEFADGTIEATESKKTFRRSFQASADSVNYRVIVHCTANDTTQRTIIFDRVKYAPAAPAVIGAPVTDWKSYTATLANLGNATQSLEYRRIGDSIDIRGRITIGSTLPTGRFEFSVPSGLSIVGGSLAEGIATGAKTSYPLGSIQVVSTTNFAILSTISNSNWNANVPFTWAATEYLDINMRGVGIAGFSSGVAMSETTMNREISLDTRLAAAQNVTSTALTTVVFNLATTDTVNGLNTSTGIYTVPETGTYAIDGQVFFDNVIPDDLVFVKIIAGGLEVAQQYGPLPGSLAYGYQSVSKTIKLEKDDTIYLAVKASADTAYSLLSGLSATFLNVNKVNVGSQTIAASASVYASGLDNGSTVLTANVTDIDFTETSDSSGAWSGTVFTAPMFGRYSVSGIVRIAVASSFDVQAYVNGSADKFVGVDEASSRNRRITGVFTLNKGDTLSFKSNTAATLSSSTDVHWIEIDRIK